MGTIKENLRLYRGLKPITGSTEAIERSLEAAEGIWRHLKRTRRLYKTSSGY